MPQGVFDALKRAAGLTTLHYDFDSRRDVVHNREYQNERERLRFVADATTFISSTLGAGFEHQRPLDLEHRELRQKPARPLA